MKEMELNYKISSQQGHFTLPTTWMPQDAAGRQRVAVVAVFGRSGLDAGGCKAGALETMVGQQIISRDLTAPVDVDQNVLTGVHGYYDIARRTVYLHLTAAYDTATLVRSLEKMKALLQEKGFLMAWSSLKLSFAKSLFSLVLCVTPAPAVSPIPHLRHYVHTPVPDSGCHQVQGTQPHLGNPAIKGGGAGGQDGASHRARGGGGRGSTPSSPLRNLELALEDQIYRLLRKSRVITNISANSLFALPNNQAYVYIMEDRQENMAASPLISSTLLHLCGASSSSSSTSSTSVTDILAGDLSYMNMGGAGRGEGVGGRQEGPTPL
ncbi:hypothetical protein O3P69_016216 [Scylla paramamosain]|uniref:Nonsense-mediated mRNA decay factor SMG8 n=1 Tax=Scylla paramamosain TaxID=85552 RepID=A0AAW0SGP6_SCYPA